MIWKYHFVIRFTFVIKRFIGSLKILVTNNVNNPDCNNSDGEKQHAENNLKSLIENSFTFNSSCRWKCSKSLDERSRLVTITILRPAIFCCFFSLLFKIKVSSLNCHVCVLPFQSFCSCFQLAAMNANTVASRSIEKWNLHFCLRYLLKTYQNWQDNQTLKWNFHWKSPATQTLPVAVYSK